MKTCFTINCMRNEKDFLDYQELFKENKFQGIEIFYPYNVSLDQKEVYTRNIKKLVEMFHPEVVLHLPHGGKNNFVNESNEVNMDIRERMENAIDYAALFNAHKVTLHLGNAYNNSNRIDLINNIIEEVKHLCDYAIIFNINVMIENMPGYDEIGFSIEELKYIINNVNRNNIKFILDTGHAHVSKYRITDFIYQLKDYLYHIHFSDNDGSCDQHRRIHNGTIDFDEVFKALSDIGYNELHCLEIIFKDGNDLRNYLSDIKEYDKYYK